MPETPPQDPLEIIPDNQGQEDDGQPSKAQQKVELDLDDAPFLQDEEEEIPEPEPEKPPEKESEEEELPPVIPLWRRPKVIMAAAGALLLLIAAAVWLLWPEDKTKEVAPPQEEKKAEEIVTPTPEPAPEPAPQPVEPQKIIVDTEPFLVELVNKRKEIRFLTVHFKFVTSDEQVAQALKERMTEVRDGIYYYLKNKHLEIIQELEERGSKQGNEDQTQDGDVPKKTLKSEITDVVNQRLVIYKIDEVLVENFLVQ